MILTIERVLQLLSEGKSVEKIAELSEINPSEVCTIIDEARKIILEYDKQRARKKIILKKAATAENHDSSSSSDDDLFKGEDIFKGSELSAVPLGSSLVMYTDGASSGNPGHSGIGITINDSDGRQVGKVTSYIGKATNNFAEYSALIRALKIAIYFKTKSLKIRTDSELVVKQLIGEYKVKNENIKPLYDLAVKLIKKIPNFKVEHVTRNFNEKADYLAKKGSESFGRK